MGWGGWYLMRMHNPVSRRNWLAMSLAAASLAPLPSFAAEPFKRPGQARMRLSLAAYSFREFFEHGNDKRTKPLDQARKMDLFSFLDYCAAQNCDAAELTSYYFPPDADAHFVLKVKRHAFLRGVAISGTAVGNTFTHGKGEKRDKEMAVVKKWIDNAALMGAPHVRIFAGSAPSGVSHQQAVANCIENLNEACAYAAQRGVFLGIENHGGIVAESDELLRIVQTVKSDWLGINLDSANFKTADPYADFEKCAPYAVNVQIKTEINPKGAGKKPSDLRRYIDILTKANYQGYVALEFEEESDPYQRVPGVLKELRGLLRA